LNITLPLPKLERRTISKENANDIFVAPSSAHSLAHRNTSFV